MHTNGLAQADAADRLRERHLEFLLQRLPAFCLFSATTIGCRVTGDR